MAKKKSPQHNLYWEALINQYNLITMGAMVALAVVTGSFYPILVALALEMMYVALVPETKMFQRYVENKYSELSEEERLAKLRARLARLHPVQQRRFEEIAAIVDSTRANIADSDTMGTEVVTKLETLRERYLWLMELLNAYEHYLGMMRPNQISDAIRDVDDQLAAGPSDRVRESLDERREVLVKRQTRLERVNENHAIVRNQVMTIEDILRLIHESSMTIHNPKDIGRQIDDLLIDVEATEEAVHDLDAMGSISGQDDLDAFDKELEEALHHAEMEVQVTHSH